MFGHWQGRRKRWIGFAVLFVPLFIFGFGWLVMNLWNAFVPGLMGFKALNLWQALGLLLLARILFGGFGRRFGYHRHAYCRVHPENIEEHA